MEKVLITGGAGFIGRAIAEMAIKKGASVIIVDNFTRNSIQYFSDRALEEKATVIRGDIRDRVLLEKTVNEFDPDYIFHLAAIAGVSKYFSNPVDVLDVNIIGTFNLLESLKNRSAVKAVFDFSTSEIYGSDCYLAKEDGQVKMENLFEKRWTYATSKIASEKIGLAYFWQYEVPFIGIRPFNVYGPGQVGEGVISYMLNSVIRGQEIKITGDGTQARTFCFIEDFLAALLTLIENLNSSVGSAFNIGTNTEIVTVNQLASLIEEVSEVAISRRYVEHLGEDVKVRSPSISRIEKLGFTPKVSLRDGLKRTLEWYRENQVSLD